MHISVDCLLSSQNISYDLRKGILKSMYLYIKIFSYRYINGTVYSIDLLPDNSGSGFFGHLLHLWVSFLLKSFDSKSNYKEQHGHDTYRKTTNSAD